MILQSLHALYHRLAKDPRNGLPTTGYSLQNISFRVVIRKDGILADILPCRTEDIEVGRNGKEKKVTRPLQLLVPGQAKPSGQGLNPCFLWDNTGYLLGFKPDDTKKSEAEREKEKARTLASFEAFKKRHLECEELGADEDFNSVCLFLRDWNPDRVVEFPILKETTSGFGVFQIAGQSQYVHQSPAITRWWDEQQVSASESESGFCLVTGRKSPLAQLHDPAIKGVAGAQSSGAKLVSFNLNAFTSLAKEQGLNSPVSEEAAFAYCNALNWLLARKERRFRIGDATTVFWTEEPTPLEKLLPWMISGVPEAEDGETKNRIRMVLEKISRGTIGMDEIRNTGIRYFILGLSPNASRLSVRFWHSGTLGDLVARLRLHFEHLSLVRQWDEKNSKNPEPITPSAFQLLRQTSRDADGIPPLFGGSLMRAILLGTAYPQSIALAVINRIRAEREVSYLKAAILKAWLVRNHQQQITIMLDETNPNPGYRLGRLFAVLEKAQQDALPGINATIRDRFYSSASATPRSVFGRLLRNYQNHLGKLEPGGKLTREKQTQEILAPLSNFPAHLNLQDQAQFALGYYHQRKDLYTKKESKPAAEGATD